MLISSFHFFQESRLMRYLYSKVSFPPYSIKTNTIKIHKMIDRPHVEIYYHSEKWKFEYMWVFFFWKGKTRKKKTVFYDIILDGINRAHIHILWVAKRNLKSMVVFKKVSRKIANNKKSKLIKSLYAILEKADLHKDFLSLQLQGCLIIIRNLILICSRWSISFFCLVFLCNERK